jgi:malate dehydrogenase (quinone)
MDDWELEIAGQRVQVIKKDEEGHGILEFGTEVVTKEDGSLAALLGASPGASTSAWIMIGLLEKCFPQTESPKWRRKLLEMVPSYGRKLNADPELAASTRARTSAILKLVN